VVLRLGALLPLTQEGSAFREGWVVDVDLVSQATLTQAQESPARKWKNANFARAHCFFIVEVAKARGRHKAAPTEARTPQTAAAFSSGIKPPLQKPANRAAARAA